MTTPRDQIDATADNVIDTLPCSVTQARFWFLEKIEPGNAALNVALRWELSGVFRAESIEQAFRAIIARHEILRTRFVVQNGEPMQQVLADIPFKLSVIDLTRLPSSTRMDEAQEISAREAREPFVLSETPLIRATLLQLDDDHAHLLITVHHIAFDGWSIRVLGREIGEIASAIDSGREPILPNLPLQYADFGLWQREFVKSQKFSDDKEYWLDRLSDAPYFEVLTDRPRTPRQTFNGDLISELVPLEVSEKLTALAKSEGVSLFSVGVATIAAALHRFTGENEIVIGTQVANRDDADLEDLIGVFINNIVLRLDAQGDPTFSDLLKRSAEIVQDGLMHSQVPFDDLVRALRRTPDLSRAPLYSVNFIFQRAFMENARYGAFELAGIPSESPGALLDLDVVLVQRPDGWRATIQFNTDLYDRLTAERILELWQLTMRAAATSPYEHVSRLDVISAANKAHLSRPSPRPNYPHDKSAHALFTAIADAQPDAVALIEGERAMTYGELERRSNQMARLLQTLGARRGRRVAVVAPRSIETIVSFLSIIKTGAAYLPIDGDYPVERLAYMLDDCAPALVIAHKGARDKITGFAGPIVDLDMANMEIAESDAAIESDAGADDPIYIMYTSGSTGHPKGTIIPHRGIVRMARAQQGHLDYGPRHTMLHVCALAFDASAQEIWCALLTGARVAIIRSHPASLAQIEETIVRARVTLVTLPTALFHVLAEHRPEALRGVRQIMIGGDVLSPAATLRVFQACPDIEIINGYGPTENTIDSTNYVVPRTISADAAVPIGRAIGATDCYILDGYGNLAPPGAVGELYVGGDGVALGYHNRPDLTAEKFPADRFATIPGARLYRTGDLVRLRPDGLIEYIGRADAQVKIRGMRVEPGEVEAALVAHESVGEAIVVARDAPPAGKQLFAYVSPAADRIEPLEALPRVLHEHLSRVLPPHMVPAGISVLRTLPQTPNGKVDRRALPNIPTLSAAMLALNAGEDAPVAEHFTEAQNRLREIWREVLQQDDIGLNDSFFDLGGHSLLAFRMFARVEEVFGRKLEILALFQSPTLRQFSLLLNEAPAPTAAEPIEDWQIIRLQANGAKTPIVAIDNPILYYQLAKNLGADQPFTCLQLFNPDRPQTLAPQTFPEIAAQYVRLLKAAHPTGPYHLMGLCIAGALAVEVARQLQAGGDDVNVVITYDTWRPGYAKTLSLPHRLVLNLSDRIDVHIRRWESFRRGGITVSEWAVSFKFMNALIALALKLKIIKSAPERTAAWSPPWFQQHLLKARRTIDSFSGDLMVFKSEETPRGPLFDPYMGWRATDKGRVMIYDVKGGHLSMLAAPNAGDVAAKIKAVLDAAPAP